MADRITYKYLVRNLPIVKLNNVRDDRGVWLYRFHLSYSLSKDDIGSFRYFVDKNNISFEYNIPMSLRNYGYG
jgi:hypothetical protein